MMMTTTRTRRTRRLRVRLLSLLLLSAALVTVLVVAVYNSVLRDGGVVLTRQLSLEEEEGGTKTKKEEGVNEATRMRWVPTHYYYKNDSNPEEKDDDTSGAAEAAAGATSALVDDDDDDQERGWSTTTEPFFDSFEASAALASTTASPLNSHEWLVGPRVGNSIDMPDSYVRRLLLGGMGIGSRNMGMRRCRNNMLDMYLSQSVCHPQSRFRRARDDDDGDMDSEEEATDDDGGNDEYDYNNPSDAVKVWTTRLVYLSTIYHQHRYAVPEAKARYSTNDGGVPSSASINHYGVGNFDYECQGAKFIVAALGGNGLGINVRGGIVEALLAGLTSNRVVLLINNHHHSINSTAGTVHPTLTRPWPLASCPRHDYQCFFFPISPCVLTHRDLSEAYTLTRSEIMNLRKGIIPEDSVQNKKVWVHTLTGTPHLEIPPLAAERLYNYSKMMLEYGTLEKMSRRRAVRGKDAHKNITGGRHRSQHLRLLRRAANNILRRNVTRRPLYNYAAANVPIHHALAVVATRPNLRSAKLLRELLSTSLSSSANTGSATGSPFIDPDRTVVGLPIRASDKCLKESECLSFQQHLDATSLLLQVYHGNDVGPGQFQRPHQHREPTSRANASAVTLVVTSESIEMAQAFQQFKANSTAQSLLPYRFRLVTNDADVTPNTGFALSALGSSSTSVVRNATYPSLARNLSFTADDMMLSAVSSLQHQLLAQITIANCCSNFHVLLADLHMAGCGASATAAAAHQPHTLHCLQEHVDPRYRLCCGWFRNCKEEKRLAIEEFLAKQQREEPEPEPSNWSTTTA